MSTDRQQHRSTWQQWGRPGKRRRDYLLYHEGNTQLSAQIAAAQSRLHDKLVTLDVKSSGISEYTQRYLGGKTRHPKAVLQLYSRLLYLALNRSAVSPERVTLVDYGGGSGILSFLARELGVGTVVYNDIYDVACTDVRRLSSQFGLPLDHVVCGDIDQLVSYLRGDSLSVDAIVSHNVLEHIYDVGHHFRSLASLSDGQFRVVYTSVANIENPRYVHAVTKRHNDAEYRNRKKKWGHKERDSLRAFLDVRKEIISGYAPELTAEQVERLSRLTRGLIQSDIQKCVDEYRQQGCITYRPDHPTNTCDPYTGNWCEHLIDTRWLQQVIEDAGFAVEILAGYFPVSGSLAKRGVARILNAAVHLLQRRSMLIAPYYVVYAESAFH